LHRLGLEYRKPDVVARKLDVAKQQDFIESYDKLLNFWETTRPCCSWTRCIRPLRRGRSAAGRPNRRELAIEQTSGCERINIHGAINLENGQTFMIDVETVNVASTITLLEAIEALYPMLVLIHVFLDNVGYHHAKLVAGVPDRAAFHSVLLSHLNPIEGLWGLMHRKVTHNKTYETRAQFADAAINFLREKVPRN
jgi:transposase